MRPEDILVAASVDVPPVFTSVWQAFSEDVEFAGLTVSGLSATLDIEISEAAIPKAALAYLELALKVKDSRHGEVP